MYVLKVNVLYKFFYNKNIIYFCILNRHKSFVLKMDLTEVNRNDNIINLKNKLYSTFAIKNLILWNR